MDEGADTSVPVAQPAAAAQNGDVATEAVAEQADTAEPSQASDEEVKQRLLVLLGNSDLNSTTEKMLRKQLEKELGQDLSSKKRLIREEVLKYLEQQQGDDEGDAEEEAVEEEEEEVQEKPKKRSGGFGGLCLLSEELQKFTGEEKMTRAQVVKSIWDYIKANDLQNPKDRRQILLDAKLGTIFKNPLTMFSMNKQLTKHVFKASDVKGGGESDDDDDDDEPAAKPKPAAKKPAKRARKAGSDDEDGGGKRKGTGFAKPLPLSDEFAAACGKSAMSRGEISKWIYSYCDEHNLKDPSDKRFALCDETLEKLTGEKRIQLFGGQKYFKEHILKD